MQWVDNILRYTLLCVCCIEAWYVPTGARLKDSSLALHNRLKTHAVRSFYFIPEHGLFIS
jgi:hypothetical protein